MDKLGLEILESSPEKVVGRVPVEGNTQPYGILHGGVSAALAEALATSGAGGKAIEIQVHHIRAARSGFVTGVATPVFAGNSLHVWETRMTDDDERLTAFATITISVV